MQTVRGETEAVIEERRPGRARAPLHGRRPRRRAAAPAADVRRRRAASCAPNPVAARLDGRDVPAHARAAPAAAVHAVAHRGRRAARRRADAARDRVRVRRAGCDQAVEQCLAGGHPAHRRRPNGVALRAHRRTRTSRRSPTTTSTCSATTRGSPGSRPGVAAHHAGMVPPMKEAVEEAFAAGLLKVVFATETLSLGINMPARVGRDREALEVHRRAPRVPDAGRVHAARGPGRPARHRRRRLRRSCCGTRSSPFEQVAGLASRRTYALTSSFRADLQHGRQPRAAVPARAGPPPARTCRSRSSTPTATSSSLERAARTRAASSSRGPRAAATHPAGDVEEYRRLLAELDAARRAAHGRARQPARHAPARRRRDRAAARRQGRRAEAGAGARSGNRVLALTAGQVDSCGSSPHDFRGPIRKVATIELPAPVRAAEPGLPARRGRRAAPPAASTTPSCRSTTDRAGRGARKPRSPRTRCTTRPAPTPRCGPRGRPTASRARSPASSAASRAATRAWPASSTGCSACSRRGATSTAGSLSPTRASCSPGSTPRATSCVAESLREGLLDGLDPPTLAAVVSCFTYQRRGPDGNEPMPPRRWPSRGRRARVPRDRAHLARPATSPNATNASPRPAGPTRASPPRSTPGRRATTSPTSSRTRR